MLGVDLRFDPPSRFAGAYDELHALAGAEAGWRDFCGPEYQLGLRVLLESMDYDPHFSERGRRVAWGNLVNVLASRAHAAKALQAAPEVAGLAIDRPVIITGLHRSGTTALHKLLSADPRFQGLQGWLTAVPMPRPPRDSWAAHPAFHANVAQLEARFAGAPGLRSAHDMVADDVDECGGILFHSFTSIVWTVAWSAASYDAWWQTQDERESYRYFRRLLQLIGSTAGDQRWLLKHPPHIAKLALLFQIFPDARVIQTHRDPGKAIPSLCSLIMNNHDLLELDRKQQRARLMGYRLTGYAAKALREAEPVRQKHRGQILDVMHADFHRDPIGELRRIYPFIGLEFSPETEALMRAKAAAAPAAAGGQRYEADTFGLSADAIREQFGDYMKRFDLGRH